MDTIRRTYFRAGVPARLQKHHFNFLAGFLGATLLLTTIPSRAVDVLSHYYDNNRDGANTNESTLTPSNVNVNNFGKLFTHSVDGQVYAQPLYVSGVVINSVSHNVVFICTENNSVYAFDADNGSEGALWHVNFGTPVPSSDVGSCSDLTPVVGITGTPVIDISSGTIYVDARTLISGTYSHHLHALDITSGGEKFGGPVQISASASGHNFDAHRQHQRAGLILLNGVVYIAFTSNCDTPTYWGWLLGYDATTLAQTAVFNVCPTGTEGAIWSCGKAPAIDSSGNIYVETGNGTFNANTGGGSYGDSFIKLSTPNLSVVDYFCPSNQSSLSSGDVDLGAGGPTLLPNNLLVGMGKEGIIYLINENNMGHFSSSHNNIVQEFSAFSKNDKVGPTPVYWQGPSHQYIYISPGGSKTKVYTFNGSTFNTSAVAQSSETQGVAGGASLSANGNSAGILWVVDSGSGGTLRAYNADAVSSFSELWNSQDNSSRDSLGTYNKFTPPIVANGKVYVGTHGDLVAYGLLGAPTPDFSVTATPSSQTVQAGSSTSYTVNLGNINGFTGTVSLSATGLPSGATPSFNPSSTTTPGSSTLTVDTSTSTPAGSSTLTITGTSGSLQHSTNVTLIVSGGSLPPGWTDADIGPVGMAGSASFSGGTFTVSGSGADIFGTADEFNYAYQSVSGDQTIIARVVSENGNQSYSKAGVMIRESTASNAMSATVLITPTNGVAMEVRSATGASTINMTGWIKNILPPRWVKVVRSGNTFTGSYSADGSTWTQIASTNITMNSSATAGLAVTDHSNTGLNTANFDNVSITGAAPDFSLSPSPSSLTITQGGNGTSTITINPINGYNNTVSFSASGLPSGVTYSFNPTSSTTSSTLTLTASSTATTGPATITVSGTDGTLTNTTTINLTVNAPAQPDFSLSASPSSLTIVQGNNGTSTITVNPTNGYNNTVSLSASGLPSGVTYSFNPTSTTTSSTLTLTASSSATTGPATVTVTGTDGTLTHMTTINLTVNSSNNFAGVFQIQNEASLLVMNNQGRLTNGAPITQWTIVSSSNLDWTFIATSNGYFQINSSKSGLDAAVQSASTSPGAGIVQWALGSSGDDQWQPVQNSDGSYTFHNLNSGLVLSVPGGSTNKATQLDQETATGGSNQNWKLLKQ